MMLYTSCISNQKSQAGQSDTISIVQTNLLSEEEAIVQMLREFYTEYITACYHLADDTNIKNKYCTSGLISNFQNGGKYSMLDADPFLNAQDCDLKTIKTLQINKDTRMNVYNVTYWWWDNVSTTIHLLVAKTEDGYKIDAILSPLPPSAGADL